ncbi:MAG TPA: hypothetical protein VGM63_15525 [Mucilaginibacter sp.]
MEKRTKPVLTTGKVDNFNFLIRKGSSLIFNKAAPTLERIRENNAEFGNACRAGKIIRRTFKNMASDIADGTIRARLSGILVKVLQTDTTHVCGLRTVQSGNLTLIEGFQFNGSMPFETVLSVAPVVNIERSDGKCFFNLPCFVPAKAIMAPRGTTHFKILVEASEIDFAKEINTPDSQYTPELPIDNKLTEPINMQLQFAPGSTHPIIIAAGVVFYQLFNEEMYLLRSYRAMKIVKV